MPFFKPGEPARDRRLARIDTWVWTLVYGGLLGLVLGLFVLREDDAVLGHGLVWGGGIVAALGVLLLLLRARMTPRPGRPPPGR